ncbi:glycosyltransferase family 2 protein [Neosynechococcus sphagnicola]|uniref:glycosyltransferase family 2 protein n=1 Tax=Neosynechococcus sphagnicola TaxID=1501145 RepID=UPI00195535B9|nr:hypothetical protein [Neosynechococcus sphagnicola]
MRAFFLYVEDIDWAQRIHRAGWQVYYVPTAQIIHHHLAVSDRHLWSRYTWLHLGSMVRYARKYWCPLIPGLAIRDYSATLWQIMGQIKPPPNASVLSPRP